MLSLPSCVTLLLSVSFVIGEITNQGWWKNAVFYQVYPRSFMDANGDGIGDLQGIINKLEYFKTTGITAIWLSPIYTSPMVDFGYDISNFRDVDQTFGTMKDLENLIERSKQLGVKIIMDLIPNHTSNKHEWFIKSTNNEQKYNNYYVWRKGKNNDNNTAPNNWISVFSGSAWKYNSNRDLWYLHQFEYRQPDLNYNNPDVRREIEEIIKFWLGKGIDGFRIDAIPYVYENDDFPDEPLSNASGVTSQEYAYLNHIYSTDNYRTYELVKSWRKILDDWSDTHNEDEKILFTEAYTNLLNTTKYYRFGSQVPFNFNFITNVHNNSKPAEFKKVIDDWIAQTPINASANWVMGNHDRSRTATRYPGRADQMTMLAMILPGIAVTYNGEEIAMEDKLDISWKATQDPQACNTDPKHYKIYSRDPNRTPFQWDDSKNAGFSTNDTTWLPIHENYKTINLAKQIKDVESHYNLYRRLIMLRSNSNVLKNGTLKIEILNNDEVLSVIRQYENENVILLINFSNDKLQHINVSSHTNGVTNGTIYISSVQSGIKWNSSVSVSNITLKGKASLILLVKSNAYTNGTTLTLVSIKLLISIILISLFKLT
ncbi:PREDICTED: maltase 2-like [Ceratosolen solmsi marchali]|uniref:alpha-glucosidase n=1 Tax=Ceratosolen solmsi marchali TaxID=326594 RepID=A0AAJ6YRL0_9HYME|nr:PREDICTED: maltase 2-like [Ceratosolen solmsi marchali]